MLLTASAALRICKRLLIYAPAAAPPAVPLLTRYKMENPAGSGKQRQNYIYLLLQLVEKEYTVMGQREYHNNNTLLSKNWVTRQVSKMWK